jgi:phospholipase D
VITGSFNFTNAAQKRNAENVLFVESTDVATAYREDWIKHFEKSRR